MKDKKLAAILGSGKIGTDLLYKLLRSRNMRCACFVGRREESEGIQRARKLGVPVSTGQAEYLLENPDSYEIVFDATSAIAHAEHSQQFAELGKMMFDLTPSHVGAPVVPTVNAERMHSCRDVSLVSCGGQVALPIVHAVSGQCETVDYIEMVNTSASQSAGLATRLNIDEYLETTEAAIADFSGCEKVKCLLALNPATPPAHMRVTITFLASGFDRLRVTAAIGKMVAEVQRYVPGYALITEPVFSDGKIIVLVRVTGQGDYLEEYAGNLDIINAAAVYLGELYSDNLNKLRLDQGAQEVLACSF